MKKHYLLTLLISFAFFSGWVAAEQPVWSFVITGDSRGSINGVNVPILKEIAKEIVRQKADFVIFTGDLVGGGNQKKLKSQLTNWLNCMQPVYDAGIDVYPIRGNHDVGNPAGTQVWNAVFSGKFALPKNGPEGQKGLTYSAEHKNVLLLGLDQYVVRNRVDLDWTKKNLEANNKPHVFVFGHVPAFGLEHNDCLDDHPEQRNEFWKSLKKAGCRVYACGHDHFFDHSIINDGDGDTSNDIHQLVVGTAGAPLKKWSGSYNVVDSTMLAEQWQNRSQHGYVLVEVVSDLEYRTTWFERNSESGNYFAASPAQVFYKGQIDAAGLLLAAEKENKKRD